MVASPGASSPGGGTPVSSRSRSPSSVSPNGGSGGGGGDPSCRVSVAVRIRPLLGQELSESSTECIAVDAYDRKQVVVGGGPDNRFTFDHVFSPQDRQASIYQECVGPLVAAHMDGYNATILAYGQTGSGKTHTMGSASNLNVAEQDQGIIPRVIDELFRTLAARRQEDPASSYRVSVQFLEIYGEEVKDLLDPLSPGRVAIREQPGGGIAVVGAKDEAVESAEEMMLVLERGTLCRTTGSTLMNAQSSRSHAIFTVLLERRIARAAPGGDEEEEQEGGGGSVRMEVRKSKFHFVDLAGSERAKRTGAQGKRLKEGIEINKGLLVLGNVISALGDAKKKGQHVPYRDSKLTRMLQDSLGGNSQTLMIACVSPAEVNLQESLNALRYANRARNIQNKPVLNRDRESLLVDELRQQVQALATELLRLKSGKGDEDGGLKEEALVRMLQGGTCSSGGVRGGTGAMGRDETTKALTQRCQIAEAEVKRLAEENAKLRQQYSEASDEVIQVTADRDYYRICLQEATGASSKGLPAAIAAEEQQEAAGAVGEGELVGQRGPFADHLRPYLQEIRALQHHVRDLEQAAQHTVHAAAQQTRRRSSASALLLSSLLAAAEGGGSPRSSGAVPPPSVLLQMTGAEPSGAPTEAAAQQLETELEKDLRLATEAEAGAFYRAHQEMSATVADLTRGIELKERLAAQLCESIKRYEVMRRVYEEKLRAMEEETARYDSDRQKLLHELEQLEKRLAGSPGQKLAQHTQQQEALLRKIQEKEAQLQAAIKKEEELGRLARQAQKTENQLKQLNDEIAGMKRQKMDLLHKIDAERRKFQALLREKTQEIESMRRAAQRDAKEIQRLEQAVEKADKERRKQEEDFNRLRASSNDAGALPLNRQVTANRAQKVQGRRYSSAAADKLRYSEEERRTKKWLDARIREVAKREEAAERLAAEYQRRMTLLKTKEDLEQARVKFFSTRRGGAPQAPRLTTVRDVILSQAQGQEGAQVEAGEAGVEAQAPLTPEEEATLEELEERIAACKAQLEFKDDRIRKFETIVNACSAGDKRSGSEAGGEPVRLQVAKTCQTLEQSHAVIRVLFDMLAKANGDRSQELEDACQQASQLLEAAEKRAEAERRLCEERVTRVATEYEEKISGLIDSAATSGLLLAPAAVQAVVPRGEGQGEEVAEQLRCMLRLSNERNEALKGQMQQLQAAKEAVEALSADLEGRERRAREELRECQAQLKWVEFELTKVRSEYIKLRSERTLLATIHQQQDPLAGLLMLQRTQALAASSAAPPHQQEEEVKKLEREVLGAGWDLEEEDEEQDEGEGSQGPFAAAEPAPAAGAAEGEDGVDGPLHVEMGSIPEEREGSGALEEGESDSDDDSRAATPSWARHITEDIQMHIKQGKAPPSIMNRQSVKRALQAINAGAAQAGAEEAGAGAGAHGTIFDRLADPAHFTGIHKLHEEEAKANRQRAERIRHNGEGIKKLLHAPQSSKPKGGSLAASMYVTAAAASTHGRPGPGAQQPHHRGSSAGKQAASPLRASPPSFGGAGAEEGLEDLQQAAAESPSLLVVQQEEEGQGPTLAGTEQGDLVIPIQNPIRDAHAGFAPIAEEPEDEAEASQAPVAPAEPERRQQQEMLDLPSSVPGQPHRKSVLATAPAAAGEELAVGAPASEGGESVVSPGKPKQRKGLMSRVRKALGFGVSNKDAKDVPIEGIGGR